MMAERGIRAENLLRQCGEVVVGLQVLMVVGVMMATAVQVVLAVRVGRFASGLRDEEMKGEEGEGLLGGKRGDKEMTKPGAQVVEWVEKV